MSIKHIEEKCGCSIKDMIASLESCIKVGKEICGEKQYSVQITDWDAEHLLIVLRELDDIDLK